MLIKESEYLGRLINNLDLPRNSKILNIGSQSNRYLKEKPHIYANIISISNSKGFKVINFDLFPGDGIDIFGDIYDSKVFSQLIKMDFDAIYLFNVLEHVIDVNEFAFKVESLMSSGKHLLVSVPFKYPRHFDPIDNGFRPNPNELNRMFRRCIMLENSIIIDYNYCYYLFSSFKKFISTLIRLLSPFYKYNKWRNIVIPRFLWLNKNYQISCAHFVKR